MTLLFTIEIPFAEIFTRGEVIEVTTFVQVIFAVMTGIVSGVIATYLTRLLDELIKRHKNNRHKSK